MFYISDIDTKVKYKKTQLSFEELESNCLAVLAEKEKKAESAGQASPGATGGDATVLENNTSNDDSKKDESKKDDAMEDSKKEESKPEEAKPEEAKPSESRRNPKFIKSFSLQRTFNLISLSNFNVLSSGSACNQLKI